MRFKISYIEKKSVKNKENCEKSKKPDLFKIKIKPNS